MSGAITVKRRPSGAGRWVFCNGSTAMEAQFPDQENDIAREGTAMHEATAMVLDTACGAEDAHDILDHKMSNGVYISEEMIDPINMAVEFVKSLNLPPNELVIEQFISQDDLPYEGTTDVWHMSAHTRELHVFDHKFGFKPVEAFENWQMIVYTHLIIMFLRNGIQPELIHLHINQPRAWHPSGYHRTWTVTFQELWPYIERAYAAAVAIGDTVTAGPHCAYCKAAASCGAAREYGVQMFEVSQRAVVEHIDNAALAFELDLMDRAEKAIKLRKQAIEALAESRLIEGQVVPEWTLQNSYGKRCLREHVTPDFMKQFGDAIGMELVDTRPKPITEIERLLKNEKLMKKITHRPMTGKRLKKTKAHTIMERMNNGRMS